MRETEKRKFFLFLLFLLILGGIAILSGGLTHLQFQPGKAFPHEASSIPPGNDNIGYNPQHAWLAKAFQRIIYPASLLTGVACMIGALVSPRFRQFLLHQLLPVLMFSFLIAMLFTVFHVNRNVLQGHKLDLTTSAQPATTGEEYASPTVNPPNWSVILTALGTAVGIVGLGFITWWWFQRAKPSSNGQDILAELGVEAGAAATRIRNGADPRNAVIGAYKEMCDILSRQVENPDYLTPREFARRLRARGMRSRHVDRLTKIFEEVRYGHRESARFAQEALSCLEEIRDAYTQS